MYTIKKRMQSLLCCALCVGLALSFGGCNTEKEVESGVSGVVASPSPSASPSASPSPTPTAKPTAKPTQTPESSVETSSQVAEEGTVSSVEQAVLPEIAAEDEEFRSAFGENPVDAAYVSAYESAGSNAERLEICNNTRGVWQQNVDVFYQSAMSALAEEEKEILKGEQSDWSLYAGTKIEELTAEITGDESVQNPTLKIAIQTMGYYRDRAAYLAAMIYEHDGAMPEFTTEAGTAVG